MPLPQPPLPPRLLALCLAAALAALPACDRWDRDRLSDGSFSLGPPTDYLHEGVYSRFRETHGVLVVSRPAAGGKIMIVALDAECPHDGDIVDYEAISGLIKCPTCDSKWTTDGLLHTRDNHAKRSLHRLRLRTDDSRIREVQQQIGGARQANTDLIADPNRKFRQTFVTDGGQTLHEWSASDSMFLFTPGVAPPS